MTDFFALLMQLNKLNLSSANALAEFAEGKTTTQSFASAVQCAEENKIAAVSKANRIAQYLKKEFLPPIDREDILSMSQGLLRLNFCIADTIYALQPVNADLPCCCIEIEKITVMINTALEWLHPVKKSGALQLVHDCRNYAAAIKKDKIPSHFYAVFCMLIDKILSVCDTIEVILVKYS